MSRAYRLAFAESGPLFVACFFVPLGFCPTPGFTADKSNYSLFRPTPRSELRELSTDRPDKTESPYTVDAGHIQIETDLASYSRDRSDGVHVPRGFLEFQADPSSPTHKPELGGGKRLVLYCGSGSRSVLAAKTLKQMGIENVAHVAGGFPALQKAGGLTQH